MLLCRVGEGRGEPNFTSLCERGTWFRKTIHLINQGCTWGAACQLIKLSSPIKMCQHSYCREPIFARKIVRLLFRGWNGFFTFLNDVTWERSPFSCRNCCNNYKILRQTVGCNWECGDIFNKGGISGDKVLDFFLSAPRFENLTLFVCRFFCVFGVDLRWFCRGECSRI